MKARELAGAIAGTLITLPASAEQLSSQTVTVTEAGVSGIWILANLSDAGMRAQGSASSGWRIVAFLFGFPGTLVSYFAVKNAGERAYEVDLPKKQA